MNLNNLPKTLKPTIAQLDCIDWICRVLDLEIPNTTTRQQASQFIGKYIDEAKEENIPFNSERDMGEDYEMMDYFGFDPYNYGDR
jgi:hypothetical protein